MRYKRIVGSVGKAAGNALKSIMVDAVCRRSAGPRGALPPRASSAPATQRSGREFSEQAVRSSLKVIEQRKRLLPALTPGT